MNRQMGVVTAHVRTLEDPQNEGRVGLVFRWLPGGDANPVAFAPVAAPLAGKQRGAFFMPEVGDEVLVAFEHGDFDHPFIVGFLWNGADRPPESDPRNRVIRTPGGHELRFEDGDPKRIVLRSNGGHVIRIDDEDGSIELHGGGRILALRGGQVQIS